MNREKIIGDLLVKYGLKVDKDDPAFMLVDINLAVLKAFRDEFHAEILAQSDHRRLELNEMRSVLEEFGKKVSLAEASLLETNQTAHALRIALSQFKQPLSPAIETNPTPTSPTHIAAPHTKPTITWPLMAVLAATLVIVSTVLTYLTITHGSTYQRGVYLEKALPGLDTSTKLKIEAAAQKD